MKNKYEKLLENIELKDDPKDQIRQAVYNYDEKEKLKYRNLKMVLAMCTALLFVYLPTFLMNHNVNNNSFTIKAEESIYEIQKGKVILRELNLNDFDFSHVIYNLKTKDLKCNFAIPLSLYVEGDNIESIGYKLNNGDFKKLKETNRLNRVTDSSGYFVAKDSFRLDGLKQYGFDVNGSSDKYIWEVVNVDKDILIPYEAQRTVDAIYGIGINAKDVNLSDDNSIDREKVIKKKIVESLNQIQLEVRVNYNDGTYQKTKLQFVINENNYELGFKFIE